MSSAATPSRKRQVSELRAKGLRWFEIGRELGITGNAARRYGIAAGLVPQTILRGRKREVITLRRAGLRWCDIARELGLTDSLARAYGIQAEAILERAEGLR